MCMHSLIQPVGAQCRVMEDFLEAVAPEWTLKLELGRGGESVGGQ